MSEFVVTNNVFVFSQFLNCIFIKYTFIDSV